MSMRDIGLYVEYDGKKNVVIGNGEVKEYPIGGILCKCEYNLGYLLLPYLRHKPRRAVISLREPESTASTSYAGIV